VNFAVELVGGVPHAYFTTRTRAFITVDGGDALPLNEWSHIAMVFDPARRSLELYVNGVAYLGQATLELPAPGEGDVVIGDAGITGYMDELRIWSVARTQADIMERMSLADPMAGMQTDESVIYEGIRFADGDAAFADEIVAFAPGASIEPNQHADPSKILGAPDGEYVSLGYSDPLFTIGCVTVKFTDNYVTGSGDSRPDLYVFERLSAPEEVFVWLSEDGDTRGVLAGRSTGTVSGIDIDFAIPDAVNRQFRYAIISSTSNIVSETVIGAPGPDIDAVGAARYSAGGPLVAWYSFDDGETAVPNPLTGGTANPRGAEDFTMPLNWYYAITGVTFTASDSPVSGLLDADGNGIADWWDRMWFGGHADPAADPDSDGLSNLIEFMVGTNPKAADTDGNGVPDGDEDFDNDGLSNLTEARIGTDPTLVDTDDDGYPDGVEVNNSLPAAPDNYGVSKSITGPTDSMSPRIARSLVLGGNELVAPFGDRFAFLRDSGVQGPVVTITAPSNGMNIAVRFTDLQGSVASERPLASVRLYNNGDFVMNLGTSGTFSETIIIRAGPNELTVVAVDTEGLTGSATVTVEGTFARADIRVTQWWNIAGDLDTWLVDPLGRHMGWTTTGPGYPENVADEIPGSFLDIDDVTGDGPENITVEEGFATNGEYHVWMNNYSHSGNPLTKVRVLVLEGRPGEDYREFGPQAMPTSDANGDDPNAWWNTTTVTWPDGTMNPPGTPVGGAPEESDDAGIGLGAGIGWTAQCWMRAGNAAQTGAIAAYRLIDGTDAFVIGLDANRPFMRVQASGGTIYSVMADALPVGEWTHLAFVYSESQKSIRIHINGCLSVARTMVELRTKRYGRLVVDTSYAGSTFTDANLDDVYFWSVARNGGLIASTMYGLPRISTTMAGGYVFDDGGSRISDYKYDLDRRYDLALGTLPDALINAAPGPDGVWGTGDDVAQVAGNDGHNDYVTAETAAPTFGIRDSDEDGIPDWYERLYADASDMGPYKDTDTDGLDNINEYLCGTNPMDVDSDGDGKLDGDEDADGDGVSNYVEQEAGSDPTLVDTDDDGTDDADEIAYGTDPADPLSPAKSLALRVFGNANSYVKAPPATRFALTGFDISASVYPTSVPGEGALIVREVQAGVENYFLGVDAARRPVVRFSASDDMSKVEVVAPDFRALPMNRWTHIRGIFDEKAGRLSLYVNGEDVGSITTAKRPAKNGRGPVATLIGRRVDGYVDDAVIKGAPETVLWYLFDDGTATGGTSGVSGWNAGQVQDFTPDIERDWENRWINAGTLVNAMFGHPDAPVPATADSDSDGLSDLWEIMYGLNPYNADSDGDTISDGDEDADLDGLSNYYEYLCGTSPKDPDTVPGTLDRDGDADGDGLRNAEEAIHHAMPNIVDTDDDGLSDSNEVRGVSGAYTLANDSLSPAKARALKLVAGAQVNMPTQARMMITNSWTVEAWISMDATFAGGTVVKRSVGSAVNYEIGVNAQKQPYVRRVGVYGGNTYEQLLTDTVALARDNYWYHIAGVYDLAAKELRLYVNGKLRQRMVAPDLPGMFSAVGAESATVGGGGFVGMIDEVRIWKQARTGGDIVSSAYQTFENGASGDLVAYYRFDDGGLKVEDFAMPAGDWVTGWANAGTLAGGAVMVEAATPIRAWTAVDADSDSLPDHWEAAAFGDIAAQSSDGDPDQDGANNSYEFLAGLCPWMAVSFGDSVLDGDRDSDGDKLINSVEQAVGTLPNDVDTDDDGLTDWEELVGNQDDAVNSALVPAGQTSPLRSLEPVKARSLYVDGASRMVVPWQARHSMDAWSVAAWVRPAADANGIVVSRQTTDENGGLAVNYEIGVTTVAGIVRPYARYTSVSEGVLKEVKTQAGLAGVVMNDGIDRARIPADQWSHLAGVYSPSNHELRLFVNGELVAFRTDAVEMPALGPAEGVDVGSELTVGGGAKIAGVVQSGFEGYIDEVRLANSVLTEEQVLALANGQPIVVPGATNTSMRAGAAPAQMAAIDHVPSQIMLRFRDDVTDAEAAAMLKSMGVEQVKKYQIAPIRLVSIVDGSEMAGKLTDMLANGKVLYAEPNYRMQVFATPDDPDYSQQWGMHNVGQGGGTEDADIDAPEAWDNSTGSSSVTVAVIDTGVDYNHPDLSRNIWVNTAEVAGNGVDDDGNGYIDDVNGYDFVNNDSDPMDDHGHGSHCAGVIGAAGNNGEGVAGINWNVKIMALKVCDAGGGCDVAAMVSAVEYAWRMGARVSNNSYGGYGRSQAQYDSIRTAMENDHVFVAAAGNDSNDNDASPAYPASYDLANIIAVAATDNRDDIAWFSNYGAAAVDLGAPGVDIYSTVIGGYETMSGTSMASPHVAGAAALVLSTDKNLSCEAVKATILGGVDAVDSLAGKTVTGGRLNIGNIIKKGGGGETPGTVVGLNAYFRFDDGGETAEDFSIGRDWRMGWAHAGVLEGGAIMTDAQAYKPMGDTDGDTLPDWWEEAMGLDPLGTDGGNGADGDPDGDGVNNLFEYLAGTHPFAVDTDLDGVTDYYDDTDGDTVATGHEQDLYGTNPGNRDTDDDGIPDGEELTDGTDPASSLSPYKFRAVDFAGTADAANTVVVSDRINGRPTARLSLSTWTIETAVRLDALTDGEYPLISRRVEVSGRLNYELGVTNGYPYVKFDETESGSTVRIVSGIRLVADEWAHLAGRFDNGTLTLLQNGQPVQADVVRSRSAQGVGDLILGSPGFAGQMRDTRVWKVAQDDGQIRGFMNRNMFFGNTESMSGYLEVSGGGWVKETATTTVPSGDFIDMLRENWTLECWVRAEPGASGALILRRNNAEITGDDFNYYLGIGPGGTLLGRFAAQWLWYPMDPDLPDVVPVVDFAVNDLNGEVSVNDGNWHHVAYVRDDNGCSLYVDGMLDARQERALYAPPPSGFIGGWEVRALVGPCTYGEQVSGNIDEIRIWNRGLTRQDLIDVGAHNLTGTERGLISYLNFDFQLGKTADERSTLRDPANEYGIYVGDATNIVGEADGPPITYDPLLTFQRVALAAMFVGDDGGVSLEDYTFKFGTEPFTSDQYAGRMGASVTFVELVNRADWPYKPDSDGDGMLDEWEQLYGPAAADPWADPDRDGLVNLYEYFAGTDPLNPYSDADGMSDAEEDADNDGVTNIEEQNAGSHPGLSDTDDDGVTDGEEILAGADPALSIVSLRAKALSLDGTAGCYVELPLGDDIPRDSRFALGDWTIEAWINPTAAGGTIVERRVGPAGTGNDTFRLWLDGDRPTISFNGTDVRGPAIAIGAANWTHVAAAYHPGMHSVRMYYATYTNGASGAAITTNEVASGTAVVGPTLRGPGPLVERVGEGFSGRIDEVRIWNRGRNAEEIALQLGTALFGDEPGLVAYYRFDDGTSDAVGSGVSANPAWKTGQVEDFVQKYAFDWMNEWSHAATLRGTATFVALSPTTSPVEIPVDSDGDGLPDWFEDMYDTCLNAHDADTDHDGVPDRLDNDDGDEFTNYEEFRNWTHPCLREALAASPRSPISMQVGDTVAVTLTRVGAVTGPFNGTCVVSDPTLLSVDVATLTIPEAVATGLVHITALATAEGVTFQDGWVQIVGEDGASLTLRVFVYNGRALDVEIDPATGANVSVGDTTSLTITRRRHTIGSLSTPVTFTILSSDPEKLGVPATVTLPGGVDTVAFPVTGLCPTEGDARVSVMAPGYPGTNVPVRVILPRYLTIADAIVPDGNNGLTNAYPPAVVLRPDETRYLTIYRPHDQQGADLVLDIASDDPGVFTVDPAVLTIPAGQQGAQFTVTGVTGGTNLVYASVCGQTVARALIGVAASIRLSAPASDRIAAGDFETFTIDIDVSRQIVGRDVTVELQAVDPNSLAAIRFVNPSTYDTVSSVTISAGMSRASFAVEGIRVYSNVVITASSPSFESGSLAIAVTAPTLTFSKSAYEVDVSNTCSFVISRAAEISGGSLTVFLRSSTLNNVFTVPGSVTFPAGVTEVGGLIHGGTVLGSARLIASVDAVVGADVDVADAAVTLVPKLTRLTRMKWYDLDQNLIYSEGDRVELIFNTTMSNQTVRATNMYFFATNAVTGEWEPAYNTDNANYYFGLGHSELTVTNSHAFTYSNSHFLVTLGANPNVSSGVAIDPTNWVVGVTGADSTKPPVAFPRYAEGADTDGDGMLDTWEAANGLDPESTIGDDGWFGDPDRDGLINGYEFLAWKKFAPDSDTMLNPRSFDTDGDGIGDYDDRYYTNGNPFVSHELTYGEMYDDADLLPDWWEAANQIVADGWATTLGTTVFSAFKDEDGDGWFNLDEFLFKGVTNGVAFRGTDPADAASVPQPKITGILTYEGVMGGDYHVVAYGTPTMDGFPLAEAVVSNVGRTVQFELTGLKSGDIYLFAYKGGATYQPDCPWGMPDKNPVKVTWSGAERVMIGLSDTTDRPYYPSFTWAAMDGVPRYYVRLYRSGVQVLSKWIYAPRNWFMYRDYQTATYYAATNYYGLQAGNYTYKVASNDTTVITVDGSFTVSAPTLAAPTLVEPVGAGVVQHTIASFTVSNSAPVAAIGITMTKTNAPAATNSFVFVAPWHTQDGLYTVTLPILFGEGSFTNGYYTWAASNYNGVTWTAASSKQSFEVDIGVSSRSAPTLGGQVVYFGRVMTNLVVEAFLTPGFSGSPVARYTVTSPAAANTFVLCGLQHATYYVRAYFDANNNRLADVWESQAFARSPTYGTHYEFWDSYDIGAFDLSNRQSLENVSIVIRDRDTDADRMPDAWEMKYFSNLNRDGNDDNDRDGLLDIYEYVVGGNPTTNDTDGDLFGDYTEWLNGTSVKSVDTDGDGMSDSDEKVAGSSPFSGDTDGDGIGDKADPSPLAPASDGDGVPVWIEIAWDGDASTYNPYSRTSNPGGTDLNADRADTDGDGVSDLEEIAAGSSPVDPTQSNSLKIASWTMDGGKVQMEWDVSANKIGVPVTFYIQASTNLIDWFDVGWYVTDGFTAETMMFEHAPAGAAVVSYRLRVAIE
jgi:hypothetical protein